ncbi:MAG: sulfatase, partial [Pseudomonadota bacterium]
FALVALGQSRASYIFRGVLTAALTLIAILKLADLVSFNALARGFNPAADLPLIDAFVRLLTGALGPLLTGAAVLGAVLGAALLALLLWWATGVWSRVAVPRLVARASALAALLATVIAVAEVGSIMRGWTLPVAPPGAAFTARLGVERVVMVRTTLAEMKSFRAAVQQDPFANAPALFEAIDRDVLVIFVESYGRTSLDTPFYAEVHRETLARYEAQLSGLGLSMQSGILSAPTQGGQSWLSHATFANGLWVDNQIRYGAVLSSGRETLFHHAANNGFHTAAVMPQITLDWPESERMGFDTVLAAADLGYRGLAFNWVTMPDQFTLAVLDRKLRTGGQEQRLFAQVALASSHAPWVPVPEILPWEAIGDGQIYNDVVTSGDPPEVVWRDRERVRAQYRHAVDYALRTVFEYAVLHAADPPLMIVIGDHQAAEFIALDGRPDVPIHVIGPEHLVRPVAPTLPHRGLLPGDDVPVIAMDRMRDILLNAYSSPTQQWSTN